MNCVYFLIDSENVEPSFITYLNNRAGSNLRKALDEGEVGGVRLATANNDQFTKLCATTIGSLQQAIGQRFADIEEGVLYATRIACFKNWPTKEDMMGMLSL